MLYSLRIKSWDHTNSFCYWNMLKPPDISYSIDFNLNLDQSMADLFTAPDLSNSYSPFLRHSLLPFNLLLFHLQRFNFQKIKTSVPSACYWRLWNALQTSSCNRLRVLRYWDWSGEAEPEPMDRISFESTNLLRCSTHPNPLASKNPK